MIDTIIQAVCKEFGLESEDLLMHRKRCPIKYVEAKQIATYLIKKHTKTPNRKLIGILGYTNHSTVTKSVKVIGKILTVNKALQEQIKKIETTFLNNNI